MSHPSRTRVKICGITRPGDAVAAARAGVDAIGLVFHPASPRAVSVAQALAILAELPPFVTVTGLFVNPTAESINSILQEVALDLLQFHGDETPEYCAAFNKPFLKAIRVRPDTDINALMQSFRAARGILLDAWHQDVYGGSGKSFDWNLLKQVQQNQHTILAGGLNPANVAEAIKVVAPWGVDVSSGVESAPGIKSEELIQAFMQEVQRV